MNIWVSHFCNHVFMSFLFDQPNFLSSSFCLSDAHVARCTVELVFDNDTDRDELVEYSEQVIKLVVVLLEFISEALALEPISRLHPCPVRANVLKPSNKAKVKDTTPIAKPTSSIFTDADIQGHCCVKDSMLSLHLLDASRKNFALSKL
ncbi:unnamed protein product [Rhodiola kirilowii]